MPDSSPATRASVSAAAARLAGRRLKSVSYWLLPFDRDTWDAGDRHEFSMGVEFVTDDDVHFTASWGDAFGRFALELVDRPAAEVIANAPQSVDATAHPWWQPHQVTPVTVELVWRTGYVDYEAPGFRGEAGGSAPVAMLVSAGDHQVWVAAAATSETRSSHLVRGGYLMGMNAMLVTGDAAFAASVGLRDVTF